MSFLCLEHISFLQGARRVIENFSMMQEEGEKLALAGATGSGKTTLLKLIAGWLQPQEGRIIYKGKILKGPQEQLIPGDPEIAYLSQHFELRNHYRVEEMLDLKNRYEKKETEKIFALCRIDHLLKRKTTEVSGGERQRIALAGLLLSKPHFLLLDEPYSNLDRMHTGLLKQTIEDVRLELGITCLLVSHESRDILSWAERVMVLREGKIVQQGKPELIYQDPADEYIAGLFGPYNHRSGVLKELFPEIRMEFIRPEKIHILPQGLSAVVHSCSFMGSYYEVVVKVKEEKIVLHHDRGVSVGEEVFIGF